MPLAQEVPADRLIAALAEYLKENVKEVSPPSWVTFVKTGPHVERVPTQSDFWYLRCASLLRRLYIEGPVGVERLRSAYGGRAKKGMENEHFVKSGGSSLRKALQQLEKAGLVAKFGNEGRTITDNGRSVLDRISYKLLKEIQKDLPEMGKYLQVKPQ
ncbi:MAG: 30S ribosomal protein S19e [Candidatus Verstraetearchaeota archaeon]|nr:30S ribosomal protein S19e [Candidatus Verstraetearchaeota archaeon]